MIPQRHSWGVPDAGWYVQNFKQRHVDPRLGYLEELQDGAAKFIFATRSCDVCVAATDPGR